MKEKLYYSTTETARLLAVHPTTVIAWVEKGELPAYRTLGGHRRVWKKDLRAFLDAHPGLGTGFPAP